MNPCEGYRPGFPPITRGRLGWAGPSVLSWDAFPSAVWDLMDRPVVSPPDRDHPLGAQGRGRAGRDTSSDKCEYRCTCTTQASGGRGASRLVVMRPVGRASRAQGAGRGKATVSAAAEAESIRFDQRCDSGRQLSRQVMMDATAGRCAPYRSLAVSFSLRGEREGGDLCPTEERR